MAQARPKLARLRPDRVRALLAARKLLPELVYDVVNLEGVHFTRAEISTLLDGITVGGHRLEDERMALNQAKALKLLFARVEEDRFSLEQSLVCELQGVVASQEALRWGSFRDGAVTIAGTDHLPPDSSALAQAWAKLAGEHERLLYQAEPDVAKTYQGAISVFLQMAREQFFYDGNKRTGRLMMNGILLSSGLPAINLPAAEQLSFNRLMLDFYPSGAERAMQDFMLGCLDEAAVRIMSE